MPGSKNAGSIAKGKLMDKVTLFERTDSRISINIWAYLKDGTLVIAGQDLDMGGSSVSSAWGDSEYEYFYSLLNKIFAFILNYTPGY
ncbi:hypothetical protein JW887_02720 [Candidatus Dojkabacteria bacterium]|nr:hypothetical protein [Candidatus Dojkabacteria bacterium]